MIVVGLDVDAVGVAEVLAHEVGDVADVADHAEAGVVAVEDKADGFGGIMGDAEGVDVEAAELEILSRAKYAPGDVAFYFVAEGLAGEGVGVDGDVAFTKEDVDAACVIRVLVGEQDGIELFWGDAHHFHAEDKLFGAEAGIDEEVGGAALDEGGVAAATAAEYGNGEVVVGFFRGVRAGWRHGGTVCRVCARDSI